MVVIFGHWSLQSLILPLLDVLERNLLVPDSTGDEAVFVSEGPHVLIVNISAREAQISQLFTGYTVWVQVSIDSGNALLVGSVKFGYGVPDLSLYFEVVLEMFDDLVEGLSVCFIVILIEF